MSGILSTSRGVFSAEIWIMIFEELYNIEHREPFASLPSLRLLRLVSRWFNIAVTPIASRTAYLDVQHLQSSLDRDDISLREHTNLRPDARELMIKEDRGITRSLLPDAIQFARECEVLESLKWFPLSSVLEGPGNIPALIANPFLNNPHTFCVRLEFEPQCFTMSLTPDPKICFVNRSPDDHITRASSLLDLFELDVKDHRVFLSPEFEIPAMKKLIMRDYEWRHPAELYSLVWNFSELQYLSLEYIDLRRFLLCVPSHDLSTLRCLHIKKDQDPDEYIRDTVHEASLLNELLRSLRHLKELEITGPWQSLLHAMSWPFIQGKFDLQVLRLKDRGHRYYDSSYYFVQEMKPEYLKSIKTACPNLLALEIDAQVTGDKGIETIDTLAEFPALRRLELNAYKSLGSYSGDENSDEDHVGMAANAIIDRLLSQKCGTPLSKIAIRLDTGEAPIPNSPFPSERYRYQDFGFSDPGLDFPLWMGDES